jgi:hypothetical protein
LKGRYSVADSQDANDDRAGLDLLIRGFQVSRMLRLVADLRVADLVPLDEQVGIDALAKGSGAQSQPLIRMLRALAAFGVFAVSVEGHIRHTPRSRLLRTDTKNSMGHSARFWAAPGSWAAWGALDAAMAGGVPQMAAWNMGRFEYLCSHPDEARGFDAKMANFPDDRHTAIAAAYEFPAAALIADIGGGNGEALRSILTRFPQTRGLLFDRDDVVKALQAKDLLDGRIVTAGGSFFDRIPSGADVYLLIRVLHNWSDEDCLRILKGCRAAMEAHAVLLIGDEVLEPDPSRGEPTGYLVDMQMMAMFGSARERTEDEFHGLLSKAGFTLQRVIRTASPVSIVEVMPS